MGGVGQGVKRRESIPVHVIISSATPNHKKRDMFPPCHIILLQHFVFCFLSALCRLVIGYLPIDRWRRMIYNVA